jgi:hypothetical protein
MSMLLNFFKKVCARINDGPISKQGKFAALFCQPEPADPENSLNTKCYGSSEVFHEVNVVSFWRLRCGNIPFYSLFNFFPD